ncbi:MAG: hypothetical protein IH861_02610 [Chloroflexi bacterium]|nr:hypothetical protein [Chloroflexota bacterium]
MVPSVVEDIAVYVGLARDILLLLLLLVTLMVVFFTYRKVSRVFRSANRIIRDTEEIVSSVSGKIVRPAAAGSGIAFGAGKIAAFLFGLRRKKGGSDDGE